MGLFIDVTVDQSCATRPACRECVQVCPVDIFARAGENIAAVIAANEDECILCDLCVRVCPVDAVTITRRYVDVAPEPGGGHQAQPVTPTG